MKEVLTEQADYPWAWHRLASWYYDDNEAKSEYLEAARQLERLSPQLPPTWGHLGAALLRNNDRAGAKQAFRRGMELSPDYSFAGLWLADLQLEDGELYDAEQTLEQVKQHDAEGFVVARQIDAACRRRDRGLALDRLRELCRTKLDEPWPFTASLDSLRKAGYHRAARQVLREALEWPDANPQVGIAWLSVCGIWSRGWQMLKRLCDRILRRDV